MLQELAIIAVRGAGLGAVYALVAMSFNIVKVSSGILNFAQGTMLVLAGMAGFLASRLAEEWGPAEWLLFLPPSVAGIAALLLVQGAITLLPLRARTGHQDSWLITTMAVSIILGAALLLTQGPNALYVRSVFANVDLLGMRIPAPYLLSIALAVATWLLLHLFLTRSLTGLAISALWQDPVAARAAGLCVFRLQLIAFGISGVILGAAGYVAAPMLTLTADGGLRYVLNGFVVAVIGGMGHSGGALIAGPLVGIVMMLAGYLFGGEFQNLAAMSLLVAVLLVRPEGLFGAPGMRQV